MSEQLESLFAQLLGDSGFTPPKPISLEDRFKKLLPSKSPEEEKKDRISRLAEVKAVTDGDTIQLSDGRVVRLHGINTPEWTRNKERGGSEASQRITELSKGKKVKVYHEDVDTHGREVGCVHVVNEDGSEMCLSQAMLAEGYGSALKPLGHPYLKGQDAPKFDQWELQKAGFKAAGLGLFKGVAMPVSRFVPGLFESTERELLRSQREILAQITAAGYGGKFAELGSKASGFAGELTGMGIGYAPLFKGANLLMQTKRATGMLDMAARKLGAAAVVGGVTGLTTHLEDGVSEIERALQGAATFAIGEALFFPLARKAWSAELGENATKVVRERLKAELATRAPEATEVSAETLLNKTRLGHRLTPTEAQAVVAAARDVPAASHAPIVQQATRTLDGYARFLPTNIDVDATRAIDNPNFGVRIFVSENGKPLRPVHIQSHRGDQPGGVTYFAKKTIEVRDRYVAGLEAGRELKIDKIEAADPRSVVRFTNLWVGAEDAVAKPIPIPKAPAGSVAEHGVKPAVGDTVTLRQAGSPAQKAKIVAPPAREGEPAVEVLDLDSMLPEAPPNFEAVPGPRPTGVEWVDEIQEAMAKQRAQAPKTRAQLAAEETAERAAAVRAARAKYPDAAKLPPPYKSEFVIDAGGVQRRTELPAEDVAVAHGPFSAAPMSTGPLNPAYVGTGVVSDPSVYGVTGSSVGRFNLRVWQRDTAAAIKDLTGRTVTAGELRKIRRPQRLDIAEYAELNLLPQEQDPTRQARIRRAIEFLRKRASQYSASEVDLPPPTMAARPGHVWAHVEGQNIPQEVPLTSVYADVRVPLPHGSEFRPHSDGTARIGIVDLESISGVRASAPGTVTPTKSSTVGPAFGRDIAWEPMDAADDAVRQVYREVDPTGTKFHPRIVMESDGSMTISLADTQAELLETQFGPKANALAQDMVEGAGRRRLHTEPYPGKGAPKLATGDSIGELPREEPELGDIVPAGAIPRKLNTRVWINGRLVERSDAAAAKETLRELGAKPLEGTTELVRERARLPRLESVPESNLVKDPVTGKWRRPRSEELPEAPPERELSNAIINRVAKALRKRPDADVVMAKLRAAGSADEQIAILKNLSPAWRKIVQRLEVEQDLAAAQRRPPKIHDLLDEAGEPLSSYTELSPAEAEAMRGPMYGEWSSEGLSIIRPTREVQITGRPFLLSKRSSLEALGRESPITMTTNPAFVRARAVARLAIERGANPETKTYLRMAHDGVHAGAAESGLKASADEVWTLRELADLEFSMIGTNGLQREANIRGLVFVPRGEGGIVRDGLANTEKEFKTQLEALDYVSRQPIRPELAPKVEHVAQMQSGIGWSSTYDPDFDSNIFASRQVQELAATELFEGRRPIVPLFTKNPENVRAVVAQMELKNKVPAGTYRALVLEDPKYLAKLSKARAREVANGVPEGTYTRNIHRPESEYGGRERMVIYNPSLLEPLLQKYSKSMSMLTGSVPRNLEELLHGLGQVPGGIEMLMRPDVRQGYLYAYARKFRMADIWQRGKLKSDSLGTYREFDNIEAELGRLKPREPTGPAGDEGSMARGLTPEEEGMAEELDEFVRWNPEDRGWHGSPLDEPPMTELLDDSFMEEFAANMSDEAAREAARVELPVYRRLAICGGIPMEVFKTLQRETGIPFYTWWMQIEGGRLAQNRFMAPFERQIKTLAKGLTAEERTQVSSLAESHLAEMPGWRDAWAHAPEKVKLRAEAYETWLKNAFDGAGYTQQQRDAWLKALPKIRQAEGEYHRAFPSDIPPNLQGMQHLADRNRGLTLNERNMDFYSVGRRLLRAMSNEKHMAPMYNSAKQKMLPFLRSESQGGIPGLPDYARRLWWSYMREVQHIPDDFTRESAAVVNRMFVKGFGRNPLTPEQTMDVVSMFTGANAVHNLGFQMGLVLRNLVQPIALNTPLIGVKYTTEGMRMAYAWAVSGKGQEAFLARHGITDVRKFFEDRGVVTTLALAGPLRDAEQTIGNLVAGEAGKTLAKTAEFLEWGTTPYKWADDFNKIASWWGQYRKFMDAADKLKRRSIDWEKFVTESALDYRDDNSLGPLHQTVRRSVEQSLASGDGIGIEKAARLAAFDFTAATQFLYTRGNVPLFMQSGKGRLLGQYGTWPAYYSSYLAKMVRRGASRGRKLEAIGAWVATNYALSKVAEDAFGVDFARWLWAAPLGYTGSPMAQLGLDTLQVTSSLFASPWEVDPETGVPFPVTRDPVARMAAERLKKNLTQYLPIPSIFWPGEDMVPQLPDLPRLSKELRKAAGRPGRLWQAGKQVADNEDPAEVFKTLLAMPSTKGQPDKW